MKTRSAVVGVWESSLGDPGWIFGLGCYVYRPQEGGREGGRRAEEEEKQKVRHENRWDRQQQQKDDNNNSVPQGTRGQDITCNPARTRLFDRKIKYE